MNYSRIEKFGTFLFLALVKCDHVPAAGFVFCRVCFVDHQPCCYSKASNHGSFVQANSISSMTIYLALQELALVTIGPNEAETSSSSVTKTSA